jgi:lipoprotein-anchoring transpeptidase ErfK/SrfK
MPRTIFCMLVAAVLGTLPALAGPLQIGPDRGANPYARNIPVRHTAPQPLDLGGGLIEAIFGDGSAQPTPRYRVRQMDGSGQPAGYGAPLWPAMDPRYLPQVVGYDGAERPGTIIIDTPQRFLFLVQPGGRAIRYGIGVGRPGFSWAGVKHVSGKREWPDWRPPEQMLQRRPDLPHYMAGGPDNPLGARALYLGSSLYRIHGSNEPWTIGQAVSSGCIRMRNEDVIDLYDRVSVGTKVIVI